MAWITVSYKTREIASFVPVKRPMSSFPRNTYFAADTFSFLFSFLYIKSEFFFSFTLLFHVTSNYNEVFYPILTRREYCCSYEKRFYTLLYSWKSINRLKLSRDILYWISRHIRYTIFWISCRKTIIHLSSLFSIGKR